jgi:hypothetical protein
MGLLICLLDKFAVDLKNPWTDMVPIPVISRVSTDWQNLLVMEILKEK